MSKPPVSNHGACRMISQAALIPLSWLPAAGALDAGETVLGILIEFLRDIAVLAAATGVAWWTWREYATRSFRLDETAKAQLAADRRGADLMQLAGRLEQQVSTIAQRVDDLANAQRATDALWQDKISVHALLQSTADPFLSFTEIEQALSATGSPDTQEEATTPISGNRLRRILIELVGDGVIAQLDKDRYFIASDFEANEAGTADDVETEPEFR